MILSESRRLRIVAFTALYYCQGIPIGLLDIAIPGWLAERGVAASEIGGYVAVVGLPWAFKLLAGPFMDRFRLPSMGNRRPWVMAAQFGLMLMLTTLALMGTGDVPIGLLMALGFLVNSFAATQDVAVDGMAIDVLPIDERGRANAFMGFGQVLGFSTFGALAGWLLASFGLAVTAAVAAVVVGAVFLMVTASLERRGERYLPWSAGVAAGAPAEPSRVLAIFGDILRALVLPQSLVLCAAALLLRIGGGMVIAMLPVLAVQELGYPGAVYSAVYGWFGAAAATLGLLAGPLIDRFGARNLLIVGLVGAGTTALAFAATGAWWSVTIEIFDADVPVWQLVALGALQLFEQIVFVSMIAQFMNITWARIAATQFAVYMAFGNLARSAGAGLFGAVADNWSVAATVAAVGVLYFAGALVVLAFSEVRHRAQLDRLRARVGTRPALADGVAPRD